MKESHTGWEWQSILVNYSFRPFTDKSILKRCHFHVRKRIDKTCKIRRRSVLIYSHCWFTVWATAKESEGGGNRRQKQSLLRYFWGEPADRVSFFSPGRPRDGSAGNLGENNGRVGAESPSLSPICGLWQQQSSGDPTTNRCSVSHTHTSNPKRRLLGRPLWKQLLL